MTSPSTGETEINETSANAEAVPPKSNRISSFFSKLIGWSSRENVNKETKQNKKKRLTFFKNKNPEGQTTKSSFHQTVKEDFGVAETETLQHFSKPKPPKNRRRPKGVTTKVTPILTDLQEELDENDLEINRASTKKTIVNKSPLTSQVSVISESKEHDEVKNEINDNQIEEIENIDKDDDNTEAIVLRKNVMTELNRSLSSRLAGTKSLCQPTDHLKPKTNNNRPSDIFTQRLRSHNSNDGIENPTSL